MSAKKGLIWNSFSKERAAEVAGEFQMLSFREKPHNILGLFHIAVSILSFGLWLVSWSIMRSAGLDGQAEILSFLWQNLIFGVVAYLVLAIFVFLNYRWAMILACVFYLVEKVLDVLFEGSSLMPLVFGFVCLLLTSRAVLTANALKQK